MSKQKQKLSKGAFDEIKFSLCLHTIHVFISYPRPGRTDYITVYTGWRYFTILLANIALTQHVSLSTNYYCSMYSEY